MDGQRFDAMAKAMATGATRRRALRQAGGGLAGALLAAAGLGRRAEAQEENTQPCDELLPRCLAAADAACVDRFGYINSECLRETGGAACSAYLQACSVNCGYPSDNGQACQALEPGGEPTASGCPQGRACAALLNPANHIVCRCIEL